MQSKPTQVKCVIEINDNMLTFPIDEPKPNHMAHTDLEVKRLVRGPCYCPDALVVYKGMLQWSIIMDSVVCGKAYITFLNEGS